MNYIPFLKAKKNELNGFALALRDIDIPIKPFLDVPRAKDDTSEKLKKRIDTSVKYIEQAQLVKDFEFYIDIFDIDLDISIDGKHAYNYVISKISHLNFIPVFGFDRDPDFLNCIHKNVGLFNRIAIRLQFDDVNAVSLCISDIDDFISQFSPEMSFDIVLDMRLLEDADLQVKLLACQNFLSMKHEACT